MAKRKRNTPFGGRKKFNRAVMNSDMDGKGDKASHVQGSATNGLCHHTRICRSICAAHGVYGR